MQLEARLALPLPPSAPSPHLFELVRPLDRRALFHDHPLKACYQFGGNGLLGLDALFDQFGQHPLEELGGGLAKALA